MNISDMPEYIAYCNAKRRCTSEKGKDAKDYYLRGIKFLFNSFSEFLNEVGYKPSPEMVLDRINNNGNYEVGNVRWVTTSKSAYNRRITQEVIDKMKSIASKGGQVARESGQAKTIAHIRWHVNKGIIKENCILCNTQNQV